MTILVRLGRAVVYCVGRVAQVSIKNVFRVLCLCDSQLVLYFLQSEPVFPYKTITDWDYTHTMNGAHLIITFSQVFTSLFNRKCCYLLFFR